MKQTLRVEPQTSTSTPPTAAPAIETFDTLYNTYVSRVYQKCLSMTKDAEMAQDFTQDIFIKVYNKLGSFQNRSTFSTWLYSVSHNYCLDQIRVAKRLRMESLSDHLVRGVEDQDQSVSVEYRLQALEGVMNKFPREEIDFLRLKYEQNRSIREIAEEYRLTESAVKMRLKRTRDRLNELYNNQSDATELI